MLSGPPPPLTETREVIWSLRAVNADCVVNESAAIGGRVFGGGDFSRYEMPPPVASSGGE